MLKLLAGQAFGRIFAPVNSSTPKSHKLPIHLFLKCTIFAAYNHRSPNMYLIIAKVGK